MIRTYHEAATILGIDRCRGITAGGILDTDIDHERGTIIGTTLHWRDRLVRRSNLWRFCLLVARMQLGDQRGDPHYVRVWRETTEAFRLGIRLGVRFTRAEMADARGRVRSRLATTTIRAEHRALADHIARWAREGRA